METIPPVLLGVSLFIPFVFVLALRGPLIRLFVTSALPVAQPKRQFQLDLALCLTAGFAVVVFNTLAYDFPAPSGISLMLGCAVVGRHPLVCCGQIDVDGRAFAFDAFDGDKPSVVFYDAISRGQAQAGSFALFFGCKEGLKNF